MNYISYLECLMQHTLLKGRKTSTQTKHCTCNCTEESLRPFRRMMVSANMIHEKSTCDAVLIHTKA